MNEFPWIMVAIAAVLVVIGILVVWMVWERKKEGIPQERKLFLFYKKEQFPLVAA